MPVIQVTRQQLHHLAWWAHARNAPDWLTQAIKQASPDPDPLPVTHWQGNPKSQDKPCQK